MKHDSLPYLQVTKLAAIALCILMVAGIATVMFLARGTGEDITGVVAPALLIAFLSSGIAVIAFVIQKRRQDKQA